jgi:hypothetical protein
VQLLYKFLLFIKYMAFALEETSETGALSTSARAAADTSNPMDGVITMSNGVTPEVAMDNLRESHLVTGNFPIQDLPITEGFRAGINALFKKKKISKIKKDVQDVDIAKAIAKHTKVKAKATKQQLSTIEGNLATEEINIKKKQKQFAETRQRLGIYKKQADRASKKVEEIENDFLASIAAVKSRDDIEGVTIDDVGRIIVMTKALSVQAEGWVAPKEIGKYHIRIDFSQGSIGEGVRVLNISFAANMHYDSPTISNTHCCWGNSRKDINRDFQTQNIEELVNDMIDYISSPHVQNGYLGLNGDKSKGWGQFFADLKSRKNYSWEVYNKENGDEGVCEETETISDPLESEVNINSTIRFLNPAFDAGSVISTPSVPSVPPLTSPRDPRGLRSEDNPYLSPWERESLRHERLVRENEEELLRINNQTLQQTQQASQQQYYGNITNALNSIGYDEARRHFLEQIVNSAFGSGEGNR